MQEVLIGLAKAAILVALNQPEHFDLENALKQYPELKESGASFVTLTTDPNEQLRGCIGSLEAYRPLYKDVISNAQSAAMRDPRFKALTLDEFKAIKIEVSLLSAPQKIHYENVADLKRKISPYEDGIVLTHDAHQATYLPQVWEQLPQFEAFFESLCQKSGLSSDCLSQHPEISRYHVKKYKEK